MSSACSEPRIAVLGVGNLLLRDEGVGIHALEILARDYELSENVALVDGGTQAMLLLDVITCSDRLIVIDAARMRSEPGTIVRRRLEDCTLGLADKQSAHDWSLTEVLIHAHWMNALPETVVIGIEPQDVSPWSDELTEVVAGRLPEVVAAVVAEIRAAGGAARRRTPSGSLN